LEDKIVVTESGIFTKSDVELMNKNDVHTFLIGESFMRHENPGEALNKLFETK
jgi:indole-3-glycerol phosphate synthase